MKASELDYDLPPDRIALEPLAERDGSRLMVVDRRTGTAVDRTFRELPELLSPGDVLVRNVSRVLPARLQARRSTGGKVEILLIAERSAGEWLALARPVARLRCGEVVSLASGLPVELRFERGLGPGELVVRGADLRAEMERSGGIPLPAYIRRETTAADRERYQTVYASDPGSVAAPTAGLHFSDAVLGRLRSRGIVITDVTLHVGPGTFLPLRSDDLDRHRMHAESFSVPAETADHVRRAQAAGRRVVAVGTTAVRALETAALRSPGPLEGAAGATELFVLPGFRFRVVSALLTNFHQPRTTLLALVAAFAGLDRIRAAYGEAIRRGYRFLSYGDAMIIL